MRIAMAAALVAAIGTAPMQCKRDPDPNMRREDTAGDALWDLAQDFRAKGNEQAAKETLRFLVERYPSNRHASAARDEIGDSPARAAASAAPDAAR